MKYTLRHEDGSQKCCVDVSVVRQKAKAAQKAATPLIHKAKITRSLSLGKITKLDAPMVIDACEVMRLANTVEMLLEYIEANI